LAITRRFRLFYLSYLSHPATDRILYRAIQRHSIRKILELGIGTGQRALRMIEVAGHCGRPEGVHFTAVDRFETRTVDDGPGVTLRSAYRMLRGTGARVRLVPGDPLEELPRRANDLGQFDLVVFSREMEPSRSARAWFFVPRLLHARSLLYLESLHSDGTMALQLIAPQAIRALATASVRRRAA
jgi:predicted O-methyltransferase YrrM